MDGWLENSQLNFLAFELQRLLFQHHRSLCAHVLPLIVTVRMLRDEDGSFAQLVSLGA
tara:strand:- start:246 stop:419 length:174 start_codon:yes stop_codon:yes gene_type:complete